MELFEFDGRAYEYDGKLTAGEAVTMYERCELGINQIDHGLAVGHPLAICAWVHMLMKRAGVAVKWDDVLKADIRTFRYVPKEKSEDDAEEAPAEENPTEEKPSSSGTARKSASKSTS